MIIKSALGSCQEEVRLVVINKINSFALNPDQEEYHNYLDLDFRLPLTTNRMKYCRLNQG